MGWFKSLICNRVGGIFLAALLVFGSRTPTTFAQAPVAADPAPAPVVLSALDDLKRLCALLNVEPILTRIGYNYDESKANPYPHLADPLLLKNGQKVTDAQTWWDKRRPEILEDFEREVYGRTPKVTPKVTWEVTSTRSLSLSTSISQDA